MCVTLLASGQGGRLKDFTHPTSSVSHDFAICMISLKMNTNG